MKFEKKNPYNRISNANNIYDCNLTRNTAHIFRSLCASKYEIPFFFLNEYSR